MENFVLVVVGLWRYKNMTIDEAIKHCEEVAEGHDRIKQIKAVTLEECKCAEEHRQLARWLRELKAYRDKSQESDDETCDEIWEKAYAERDGKK